VNKRAVIIGIVILVVLVVVLFTSKSEAAARLSIDEGVVEADTGSGWQPAVDGMSLSENDKVRTQEGIAILFLYDSIIVQLEPFTEVVLSDLLETHPVVSTTGGSVWVKFVSLIGIEGFSVETPNTVAIVRGTEFGVSDDEVIVIEGVVDVYRGDDFVSVEAGHLVRFVAEKLELFALTEQDIINTQDRQLRTLQYLKSLRDEQIRKSTIIYEGLKMQYDLTDEEVSSYLEDFDSSDRNITEAFAQIPYSSDSVETVEILSQEIRNKIISLRQVP